MSVTVIDRGAAKTLESFRPPRSSVDVGVMGDDAEAEHGEGITVANVAEWAEFGLGQPQRSWLRAFIADRESDIQETIKTEILKTIETKQTRTTALQRIGVWLVGEIQTRVAEGIDPPNAQRTIDRKGSSTPLIDTGQLRSSISTRIVNES